MKNLLLKRLIWFLPSITIMIAIFLFSSQEASESSDLSGSVSYALVASYDSILSKGMNHEELLHAAESIHNFVRKVAHFTEYCLLGLSLFIPIIRIRKCTLKYFLITLTICVLYASSDEIHQLFVAGRNGSVKDVFIDSMGALLGLSIIFMLRRRKL